MLAKPSPSPSPSPVGARVPLRASLSPSPLVTGVLIRLGECPARDDFWILPLPPWRIIMATIAIPATHR